MLSITTITFGTALAVLGFVRFFRDISNSEDKKITHGINGATGLLFLLALICFLIPYVQDIASFNLSEKTAESNITPLETSPTTVAKSISKRSQTPTEEHGVMLSQENNDSMIENPQYPCAQVRLPDGSMISKCYEFRLIVGREKSPDQTSATVFWSDLVAVESGIKGQAKIDGEWMSQYTGTHISGHGRYMERKPADGVYADSYTIEWPDIKMEGQVDARVELDNGTWSETFKICSRPSDSNTGTSYVGINFQTGAVIYHLFDDNCQVQSQ